MFIRLVWALRGKYEGFSREVGVGFISIFCNVVVLVEVRCLSG